EYVLGLIAKEQEYQRAGAVDDAQISALGKQWGAKYVVAIKAAKSIDGFYLEAKMVDVEKAYVAKMGAATSRLAGDSDLKAAAGKIIGLLGIGGEPNAGAASAPQTSASQPPASTPQAAVSQPSAVSSQFTDSRNRQKYSAVSIGGKTWTAENLNYKTGKSWCYGNDESNCKKYGRLYDWKTAKRACPKGWHLPSQAEWDGLVEAVGGEEAAGKRLKSKTGWVDASGGGTDDYGFSALPGGYRGYGGHRYYGVGSFNDAGYGGLWWSAAESGAHYARYRNMYGNSGQADEGSGGKGDGFSVRCVKD
ncbi:MAG: fibrobacter succinogenes major paralogous domain-containing protein, partial [Chitinispirillales bacterium]|nr:fibrobacter succinogenes major paralogous domain-containing protein [Chitinispirillales bacterium]